MSKKETVETVTDLSVPPSTPIDAAPCTPEERAGVEARTPPYDGVRVYADLLAVREQTPKKKVDTDS